MSEIPDYTQESFKIEFEKDDVRTYAVINTEMCAIEDGLEFTGRYLVYFLDPKVGSASFIIKKEGGKWSLAQGPGFVLFMLPWIGKKIDKKKGVK